MSNLYHCSWYKCLSRSDTVDTVGAEVSGKSLFIVCWHLQYRTEHLHPWKTLVAATVNVEVMIEEFDMTRDLWTLARLKLFEENRDLPSTWMETAQAEMKSHPKPMWNM